MASWLDLWRCFAGLRRPHNSRFRVVHRNKDGKLANPLEEPHVRNYTDAKIATLSL
jgi:hypothetical protein